MLLANMKYHTEVYSQAYKFALEICMDRLGYYDEVSKRPLPASYACSICPEPKGFKDVSMEHIRKAFDMLDIDDDDVPIMALFMFLQKKMKICDGTSEKGDGGHRLNRLRIEFIRYIATHSQRELIAQYAKTEMVRDRIINELAKRPDIGKDKARMHGGAVVDFYRDSLLAEGNEKKFDIHSRSVLAYITYHYQRFFSLTHSEKIRQMVDKKDFSLRVGDDKEEVSILDTIPYEVPKEVKLKDFKTIALNILTPSSVIYYHNHETFYDLWSRYKYQVMYDRYRKLINSLNKKFPLLRASRYIQCIDMNYKVADNSPYRNGIRNAREDILSVFEREFNGGLPQSKYEDVFHKMLKEDGKHQTRNSRRLFDFEGVQRNSTAYSNNDIFLMILRGFSSVRTLANYCAEAGIDPLSVPSDIFKDMTQFTRVPSFDEYIATCGDTSRLIAEANRSSNVENVATNDGIMKGALGVEEYNLEALQKLQFSTIKDLIFGKGQKFSSERSLNRAAEFKTTWYKNICGVLNKRFNVLFTVYYKMHQLIDLLEQKGCHLCERVQKDVKLKVGDSTKTYIFNVPVKWLPQSKETLLALSKLPILSQFDKKFAEECYDQEQGFYNMFRKVNLDFVICCRLYALLTKLTSDSTDAVRIFTIFADHRDIIDLPEKLADLTSIQKFIEKSVSGIADTNPYYQILDVSLCFPVGMPRTIGEINFRDVYNTVIKTYAPVIKPIRKVRDELDTDLKLSGVIVKSPFGIYHNLVMQESKILGVGVISDEGASSNRGFKRYLNERDTNYQFLVVGGKAAYIEKNGLKYFIHINGKLYCPSVNALTMRTTEMLATDKIRF